MRRFRNSFFGGVLVAISAFVSMAYLDPTKLPSPEYRQIIIGGGALATGTVDTRNDLALLSTVYVKSVVRRGYAAAGDGPAVTYNASNSACTLSAGAGDGGAQVPSADGKCWVASLGDRADIRVWGGVCNGSADTRQAILSAIETDLPVILPAGVCIISDMVSLKNGQTLRGSGGPTKTVLKAPQTFNLSALGMVRLGNGDPGAHLQDIGFDADQPNTSNRASLIAYPPAIYAQSTPRFSINNVRCNANLKYCLDMRGNSGGAFMDRFEVGALTTGVLIDGSLDFVQVGSLECWPYGLNLASTLFTAVYRDSVTECMNVGRVDGLQIANYGVFFSKTTFTSAAVGSVQAGITNATLDSGSTLYNNGMQLQIANLNGGRIESTSGLTYVGLYTENSGRTTPDVIVTGGRVSINGGNWLHQDTGTSAATVSAGALLVSNVFSNIANGNRTAPVFAQSGTGTLQLKNVAGAAVSGGTTGYSYEFATDVQTNMVVNSTWPNLSPNIPFLTSVGYYDVVEPFTSTITPNFVTPGDFSPSNFVNSVVYQRKGNTVHAQWSTTFDTNAFTTASGAFSLTLALPTAKQSVTPCVLSGMSNVTSTALQVAVEFQTPSLFFRQFVSNATMASFGNTNILPSKTGVLLRGECSYQVR